ncbi:hypothetical protein T06_6389 [Trichinella sp. T6]|nr:hypothetical protein T06_6389 [Trichinella sp. T6]
MNHLLDDAMNTYCVMILKFNNVAMLLLRLANMDCTHSWYVTSLCCFIAFKSLDTSENKIGLSGSVTSYAFIANP